jgi:hypothetical protein
MSLHAGYLFEWVLCIECSRGFFGLHVTERAAGGVSSMESFVLEVYQSSDG